MAPAKQDPQNSGSTTRSQHALDVEHETDVQDFERDELLRTLRLEDWFATAEQGVPIWCY
ncbi:MAG: hypothetical protein WCG85_14855 [Polyangia bacterium]